MVAALSQGSEIYPIFRGPENRRHLIVNLTDGTFSEPVSQRLSFQTEHLRRPPHRNDKCPHLVAAFQYLGDFDSESWQKVSSDGHLFRRRMMDFLAELPEAVCKLTTQTRWSP